MPRRRLSVALGGACVLATLFGAPSAASQTCFSATPYSFLATGGPGSADFTVSLPAGNYSVTLDTWDGYENRSDSARQRGERVALDLLDGSGVLASTPPTADLTDFVESAESSSTFSLTIDRAATVARVRHAPAGDGADSVFAAGIAICPVAAPTTTTAAPSTTVPPTTVPPTTTAPTTVPPTTAPPTTVDNTTSTTSPGRSLPGGPILRQRTTTTTAPPTTVAAPGETDPTPASSTPFTTTGPTSGVNAAPSTTAPLDEDREVRVLRQTTLNTIDQDGSERETLPFTGATSPWLIGVAMVAAGIVLAQATTRTSSD